MEQEILQKVEAQGKKIDEIYASVKKMQTYFLWALIITILMLVLPLIGLVFAIPSFIATYTQVLSF